MTKFTEFQILCTKDIKSLLCVNDDRTAQKYLNDIKQSYDIQKVLFHHFKKYFKITT